MKRQFSRPDSQSPARRIAWRLAGAALGLATLLSLAASAPAQQAKPETQVEPAIPDPPVIDLEGFRGVVERGRGRPLLVTFWATWCEPCREEFPLVNDLARKYAPQGLAVVGISLDEDAEMNLVRHFLVRYKPVFANYRLRPGKQEEFVRGVDPKWRGAIPATFFYGRDGRLLNRLIGTHTRQEYEQFLRPLLSPAPTEKPASIAH